MPIKEKIHCDGLDWIDVSAPTNEEMAELARRYPLSEHSVRDSLQPEHLPKYEYDDANEMHFLILRYHAQVVDKQYGTIQELTNKIALYCNGNLLITVHKHPAPFLDVLARRMENGTPGSSAVLSKIVWQALETYDDPAARLSEQVDFYESQVLLKKSSNDLTEALYYIKRQAAAAHKVLLLMLEPINHIPVKPGEESLLQDVRDQHLKMQTLYGQVLEEVNNLLNLSMSFAAQRTNDVVRILTLFSVFFMPLTFIVGIYGMNFEFMPELKQRWGYPAVLVVMAGVAGAIYFWFKKKKWL